MRKIVLAVVILACTKVDTAKTDGTAAAGGAPSAQSAHLAAADIAGTWAGTTKLEGTDSIVQRWTFTSTGDSAGRFLVQGSPDTIPVKVTFDADSFVAVSPPFDDPTAQRGTRQVVFRAIGWLTDGKLSGKSTATSASKPDSVVARTRWEATKAP
jgi:hypothetical protein